MTLHATESLPMVQTPHDPPLHTVTFAFGSSALSPEARRALEAFAGGLDPLRPLRVSGFTDDIGPQGYNDMLALARAQAVRDALAAAGIGQERIALEGQGRSGFVADNTVPSGRAANRRVEIRYRERRLQALAGSWSRRAEDRAGDPLRVGRYSTLRPVATRGQANPLDALVQVRFPRAIDTVGEALGHLLARSGWRLAEPQAADPAMATLMRLPLPESQRAIGPLTLVGAIELLCGDTFSLVFDPVHRLVSCELREPYTGPWLVRGAYGRDHDNGDKQ